jgi:hypothetical protein
MRSFFVHKAKQAEEKIIKLNASKKEREKSFFL